MERRGDTSGKESREEGRRNEIYHVVIVGLQLTTVTKILIAKRLVKQSKSKRERGRWWWEGGREETWSMTLPSLRMRMLEGFTSRWQRWTTLCKKRRASST